jgi:outer membrane protein TolC
MWFSMFNLQKLSNLASFCASILLICTFNVAYAEDALSLSSVLKKVKENDFRLKQLQEESKAFRFDAEAADYLPDPTLFAAVQNLPSDSFKLDQEPMTQLRVGVKQMFPKGDVLAIKSDISEIKSNLSLTTGNHRWLERRKQSEQAWLEAWYWQKTLTLLRQDQVFLEQIQEFVRSLYEVGARDQSSLIGANLALVKLSEKHIDAQRKYQMFRQQLNTLANEKLHGAALSAALPDLTIVDLEELGDQKTANYLLRHPKIERLNQAIVLSEKNVDLVGQDSEPAWGLELSYGLREGDNMDGSSRADFFSAGVNVQLPIFSESKQLNKQRAAKQRTNMALIKRDEVFNQMRFEVDSLLQQYRYTSEQRALYETDILPTIEKQRKSALQSYESDQGDFRLVMNLFLKEQAAKTMHQRLRVNEQKIISSLNYLLGLDVTYANEGTR